MTVFGMVGHLADERLEAIHDGMGEEGAHRGLAVAGFSGRLAEAADEGAGHFGQDLFGPSSIEERGRLGQPQESIGQRHGHENARVQHGDGPARHGELLVAPSFGNAG